MIQNGIVQYNKSENDGKSGTEDVKLWLQF